MEGQIHSFDISPNGKHLLSASLTTTALWDIDSGEELSRFDLPLPGSIAWEVFPPGSDEAIIVQDNSNQLIQFHINELSFLAELCIWILKNNYLRPFTCEERDSYQIEPYYK